MIKNPFKIKLQTSKLIAETAAIESTSSDKNAEITDTAIEKIVNTFVEESLATKDVAPTIDGTTIPDATTSTIEDMTTIAAIATQESLLSDKNKISDFGSVLVGAKKMNRQEQYSQKLNDSLYSSIINDTLAKSWPEPDCQQLINDGAKIEVVAFIRAARDLVANNRKPSSRGMYKSSRLNSYARDVSLLKNWCIKVLSGEADPEKILRPFDLGDAADTYKKNIGDDEKQINNICSFNENGWNLRLKWMAYKELGFDHSLKDYSMTVNRYITESMNSHLGYDLGESPIDNLKIWGKDNNDYRRSFRDRLQFESPKEIIDFVKTRKYIVDSLKAIENESKSKVDTVKKIEKDQSFDDFKVYRTISTGQLYVGIKYSGDIVKLKLMDGTIQDIMAYMRTIEGKQELQKLFDEFKSIPDVRRDVNNERIGKDWRTLDITPDGNVTPELFEKTFGFRGVQFGNYVNNKQRQSDLNRAFDALMDMTDILEIKPRDVSLNGTLGLAFGARGNGGKNPAAAHYEPAQCVINLTKNSGAGSLAHEWWHAIDYHIATLLGRKAACITELTHYDMHNSSAKTMDNDLLKKYSELLSATSNLSAVYSYLPNNNAFIRSKNLDKRRKKPYYSTKRELMARSFEAYIKLQLELKGYSNDYLVNIHSQSSYSLAAEYPYPVDKEMIDINERFKEVFTQWNKIPSEIISYSFAKDNESETIKLDKDSFIKELSSYLTEYKFELNEMILRGESGARGGIVFVPQGVDISEYYKKITTVEIEKNNDFSKISSAQGFYDQKSGLIFIQPHNIDVGHAAAVLMHEISHTQSKLDLDHMAMYMIDNRFNLGLPKDTIDILNDVEQRLTKSGVRGSNSEATAYLVEAACTTSRKSGFSAIDDTWIGYIADKFGGTFSNWMRHVVASVRVSALKIGIHIQPTVDDFVCYVNQGVVSASRGEVLISPSAPVFFSSLNEQNKRNESPTIESMFSNSAQSIRSACSSMHGIDTESMIQQFRSVELIMGGVDGYKRQIDKCQTELDYHQWVITRTKVFKDWFIANNEKSFNYRTGEPRIPKKHKQKVVQTSNDLGF